MKQKQLKIDSFSGVPESALGAVDRMIVFNTLQIDYLSKQQVTASKKPRWPTD
jgi:hypothetical protein